MSNKRGDHFSASLSRRVHRCGYCPTVLLLAVSGAIAAEPDVTPKAPGSPTPNFGLAEVVARPGKAVHFTQLLESECEPAPGCSDQDYFVEAGDQLVTLGKEGNRVYAWFRGRGMRMRGRLPAANVKALSIDQHPTIERWAGEWSAGAERKISIKLDTATRQLAVAANAEWYGAMLANGEQVVHTGYVVGKAAPDGNQLVIRSGSQSEDCVLTLEIVGEYMGALDNMHCGGMNVGFSDAYTRHADEGNDLK
jgi:hypothetical protein